MKLKPCPFCGSANVKLDRLTDERTFFVHCDDCEVQQIANYSEKGAINRWNKRAGEDPFRTMEDNFTFDHFVIGKGKVSEAEPLYGATAYSAESAGQDIIAQGEGDTIFSAVKDCLEDAHRNRI